MPASTSSALHRYGPAPARGESPPGHQRPGFHRRLGPVQAPADPTGPDHRGRSAADPRIAWWCIVHAVPRPVGPVGGARRGAAAPGDGRPSRGRPGSGCRPGSPPPWAHPQRMRRSTAAATAASLRWRGRGGRPAWWGRGGRRRCMPRRDRAGSWRGRSPRGLDTDATAACRACPVTTGCAASADPLPPAVGSWGGRRRLPHPLVPRPDTPGRCDRELSGVDPARPSAQHGTGDRDQAPPTPR